MADSVDLQGTIVGLGVLAVAGVFAYGVVAGGTILGVDTMTAAYWVLAGTFATSAVAHLAVAQWSLAWGHAGATGGWLFVLLGSSVSQILIGLLVLGLSGAYIALVTLRAPRAVEAA